MDTRIKLTNDYHNTETVVVATNGMLNKRQAARAQKALCGVSGCKCGDDFGARGPQYNSEGQRIYIAPETMDTYRVVLA